MTLNQTASKNSPTSIGASLQQHHSKAAEHYELAANSHKEVANCIGANDHAGAQAHTKVASEHVAKAQEQAVQAAQKSPPVTA